MILYIDHLNLFKIIITVSVGVAHDQMLAYSICLIHCGMDMAVHPTVDVVHNWECHAWFYRRTPVPLSENIEVQICKDRAYNYKDTAIEEMGIYVL